MAVSWTPHRFSGGVLALDVANTVVLRGNADRRFDRFDEAAEIARFAEAADSMRAEEMGGRTLSVPAPKDIAPLVIAIREATDRLFRDAAIGQGFNAGLLAEFLTACAAGLAGHKDRLPLPGHSFTGRADPLDFETALAVSALSLLSPETSRRIRTCANCGWLFVDRSRNSSRLWCDMAVCGNREKARRHYRRRKAADEEKPHAHG